MMADDAGRELFAPYGGETYELPRIESIAAEGMRFDSCYTTPVCSPSRLMLLTGLHGFRNYADWSDWPVDAVGLGTVLQSAGYATAYAGKWDFNPASPNAAGFDTWRVTEWIGPGPRYWGALHWYNGERIDLPEDVYGPDVTMDFCVDFVTTAAEPFGLVLSFVPPHLGSDDRYHDTPDEPGVEGRAAFDATLRYMDKLVGRLLDALPANTVVLFSADNGTHPAICSQWNGQEVCGGKFRTNDWGARVPLLASGPGVTVGHSATPVGFVDVVATFAELAGADAPPTDGVSFVPLLTGGGPPLPSPGLAYTWHNSKGYEEQHNATTRNVTDGTWRLYDDNRLYNVLVDPGESSPSFTGHAAIRAQLDAHRAAIESGYVPRADLNGDLRADNDDLLILLAGWGACVNRCAGNVDGDDMIGTGDLLVLLSEWTEP